MSGETWLNSLPTRIGFKVFGELNLDVAASANIASTPRLSQISKLTLFNSQQNTATVQDTKKVHQSVLNLSASLSTVEGSGSISPKAFDTSALIARDITLQESFDGAFNSSGILQEESSLLWLILKQINQLHFSMQWH